MVDLLLQEGKPLLVGHARIVSHKKERSIGSVCSGYRRYEAPQFGRRSALRKHTHVMQQIRNRFGREMQAPQIKTVVDRATAGASEEFNQVRVGYMRTGDLAIGPSSGIFVSSAIGSLFMRPRCQRGEAFLLSPRLRAASSESCGARAISPNGGDFGSLTTLYWLTR